MHIRFVVLESVLLICFNRFTGIIFADLFSEVIINLLRSDNVEPPC